MRSCSTRLTRAGQREDARRQLAEALELWPGLGEALYQQGELALLDGREQTALEAFGAALENEPEHVEALLARARLLRQRDRLERALAERGLTLGHYPQSFEHSTLGGWIATRSSGQFSDRYGGIENLLVSVRVVTPEGVLRTIDEKGQVHETRMIVLQDGDVIWVQSGHHFRGWYHRLVRNSEVELVVVVTVPVSVTVAFRETSMGPVVLLARTAGATTLTEPNSSADTSKSVVPASIFPT